MKDAAETIRAKLIWWKADIAYKAPEQVIGTGYMDRMFNDIQLTVERALVSMETRVTTPNPPDMPVFVIKAKDALSVPAILAYQNECYAHGLHDQAVSVGLAVG